MAIRISYDCLACGRSVTRVLSGEQKELCYWCHKDGKKPRYVLIGGKWTLKYWKPQTRSQHNKYSQIINEPIFDSAKFIGHCGMCGDPMVCSPMHSSKTKCLKCTGATGNANSQDNRR